MTDKPARTVAPGQTPSTRALDDPITLGRAARIVRLALARQTGRPHDQTGKAATPTPDKQP
ncbi:hypothetical protein SAMN05421854_1232 [Amycolatopsis rubida]|uniref:Uncharacterized protein n=1 Tax=Amycolatopsis rubida TaxID=112413 RepID=A0A1I6B384_9PSEU|nr:hypothetical protein SAMN05421854_1232 [Amycolatopsis rubida]